MPSLADLLRNDPWGAPPQTPLAKTVTDVGFDPSLGFAGAVQTYLSRLKKMQGGLAQDMLDTAADPNAEGIQRAANLLGGLGLKIANVPMALMPSAQELRDRGYQAGASPELQAVGGALGDMVNIPEPASVGTLLAGLGKAAVGAKGLAGAAAMAGKSAAVAPLGKGLGSLLADATPAEQAALKSRLGAEAIQGADAYHGSPTLKNLAEFSIDAPKRTDYGYLGDGLYVTPQEWLAKNYAGKAGFVHKVQMPAGNYKDFPYVDDTYRQQINDFARSIGVTAEDGTKDWAKQFANKMQSLGYVGARGLNSDGSMAEAVIFNPKSLTGGQASSASREQALNGLTGSAPDPWFEGSKIVDKNGLPLEVYHGSQTKGLDKLRPGTKEPGTWFTTSKSYANDYAKGPDGEIYRAHLSMNKPMVVTFDKNMNPIVDGKILTDRNGDPIDNNVDIVKYAERNSHKYDGVHFPDGNFSEDGEAFVALSPDQIRLLK